MSTDKLHARTRAALAAFEKRCADILSGMSLREAGIFRIGFRAGYADCMLEVETASLIQAVQLHQADSRLPTPEDPTSRRYPGEWVVCMTCQQDVETGRPCPRCGG